MITQRRTAFLVVTISLSSPLFAQTTPVAGATQQEAAHDAEINAREQQRIEAGVKSGELSTKEAAKLEKQQAHIEQMEQRDLKNGKLTSTEQAHVEEEQQKASKDIHEYKNNGTHGNASTESSKRLQSDIARNVSQQQRISSGLNGGALDAKQAGALEHGQAHSNGLEAHAASNGHVNTQEQSTISAGETHQSQNISSDKSGNSN